jgi:hypothetical protein
MLHVALLAFLVLSRIKQQTLAVQEALASLVEDGLVVAG